MMNGVCGNEEQPAMSNNMGYKGTRGSGNAVKDVTRSTCRLTALLITSPFGAIGPRETLTIPSMAL
jgi:hypothetical protein